MAFVLTVILSLTHTQGDLVIYGNNLEVYSIISALLQSGFPPYKLLHARSKAPIPCSTDPVILDCLDVGVKDAGVKTWTDLTLQGWEVDERGRLIAVRLRPNKDRIASGIERKQEVSEPGMEGEGEGEEGEGEEEEAPGLRKPKKKEDYSIACQALVYMYEKHVDMQAFKGTYDLPFSLLLN